MAHGYMPRQDSEAITWMRTFSGRLTAHGEVYHVGAEQAEAVAAAVGAFGSALLLATSPGTRTSSSIIIKNEARAEAERICRPVYAQIKNDPTIPDADKVRAGVHPINPARTRIGRPDTAPSLTLVAITTYNHTLRVCDTETPYRTRKAPGATQWQLFGAIGNGPSEYIGSYSRNRAVIAARPADHGKTIIYRARWINRRGETGPWSDELPAPVLALAPLLRSIAA